MALGLSILSLASLASAPVSGRQIRGPEHVAMRDRREQPPLRLLRYLTPVRPILVNILSRNNGGRRGLHPTLLDASYCQRLYRMSAIKLYRRRKFNCDATQ
ncbi:hypothetical protein CONLIGDRAFT_644597 [Coniochaeta ligniaria NRRL 30616]|uniref:Secreted protein n=1 Tax=Coniochaeta ligniaria NRRL 30616 TaxID=1408157 RepID=A0A1J7ILR1_9PEZI|nr:hypothetical protein CONLIGDRAFT_644597 [Coniochaeta ligniaria NRRL 30616]